MCVVGSEIDFSEPIFVCMLVALICAMCVWIETICRLGRYLLRTVARRRVRGLALVDLSTICLQNLASLDTVTQIKIHENFSIDFENFMGIAIETLVPLRYV